MKFICDAAGCAGIRDYGIQRASAMAHIAALIFAARAMAGCGVQAGRTHA